MKNVNSELFFQQIPHQINSIQGKFSNPLKLILTISFCTLRNLENKLSQLADLSQYSFQFDDLSFECHRKLLFRELLL